MWIPDQPEVNRAFAVLSADRWGAEADTITHIGDFGNSVYSFQRAGKKVILRLTDPKDRLHSANQAELDFLLYLKHCGVQVSIPIASQFGHLIETITTEANTLFASVFEYAHGAQVTHESPHWHQALFQTWGRTLAHIHKAGRSFEPVGDDRRWHWMDESLIAHARSYIPVTDTLSFRELDNVMEHLIKLPTDRETYGLIHADLGARNFHYDPHSGITVFDFGNCCYHWFVSDIAITLSTLRHYPQPERTQYRDWIVAGYQETFPIDPFLFTQVGWFIRLRILYVYLDRLMLFGAEPTDSQQATLRVLREKVHEGFEW